MNVKKGISLVFVNIFIIIAYAQNETLSSDSTKPEPVVIKSVADLSKLIQLRGYSQLRYNRLLETNPLLKCEQCDRSWGGNGGFFFRRIRLIFFGNAHDWVYIYIQPDLVSNASSNNLHYAQIRDAYFDLALNLSKTHRLRIGQSKVPYGFENLQSSQNRLSLDRNDPLNSAVANERDIGVFYYYAPQKIRERFSYLVSSGLKGSGDYGVFGLGLHNGQTANRPSQNDNLHVVSRLSYPFMFTNGQIIEPGIQAYTGKVVLLSHSPGVGLKNPETEYQNSRAAISLIKYPQPLGFQAEYNYGVGPEYVPSRNAIEEKELWGGYAMINYLYQYKEQKIYGFIKAQHYHGGKNMSWMQENIGLKSWKLALNGCLLKILN